MSQPDPTEMAKQINAIIATMTVYDRSPDPGGKYDQYYRKWPVKNKQNSCVIHWSNGSANWYVTSFRNHNRYDKIDHTDKTIKLNAFEALVPFPMKYVKALIDNGFLNQLPLYAGSFEAKKRGGYNPITDITVTPDIEVRGLLSIDEAELEKLRAVRDTGNKAKFLLHIAKEYGIADEETQQRLLRWMT